jgi:hypothetical protein
MITYKTFLCTKFSTKYTIEATPDDAHVHALIMQPQNTKDFAVTNYTCKECKTDNTLYWVRLKDL